MINSPIKNFNKETRKLIKRWVTNNVETLSVAKVINVSEYRNNRLVDVLPLPIEKQSDGQARVPDVIYRCPVVLEGNLDGYLSFPIKVGDKVAIGFCKQSLPEFLFAQKAEQYLPEDLSIFGANDAVVLGFIAQAGRDKPVSSTDFELNYKNSYLRVTPSDDITLSNPNSSINLNPSGTITATNGTATGELNTSGDITLSNDAVTITASNSGAITVTTSGVLSVTASSISLNGATVNGSGNVITASGSNLDDIYSIYDTHTHGENDNTGTTDTDPPTQQLP